MDRLLLGRKDQEGIELLFDRFIPAVVGKNNFERLLSSGNANALCTTSDEALTLLLLENSKDRFEDIFNSYGVVVFASSGRKRKFESDVPPKYSRGGVKYTSRFDFSVFDGDVKKGWTKEGLNRFNELYDAVKKDRMENMGALSDWIIEKKKTVDTTPARVVPAQEMVKMKNDLWESDTNDDKDEGMGNTVEDEDDDSSEDGNSANL